MQYGYVFCSGLPADGFPLRPPDTTNFPPAGGFPLRPPDATNLSPSGAAALQGILKTLEIAYAIVALLVLLVKVLLFLMIVWCLHKRGRR